MPWGWAQMADTPSSAGRVVADGEVLRGQLGAVCVCVCDTGTRFPWLCPERSSTLMQAHHGNAPPSTPHLLSRQVKAQQALPVT